MRGCMPASVGVTWPSRRRCVICCVVQPALSLAEFEKMVEELEREFYIAEQKKALQVRACVRVGRRRGHTWVSMRPDCVGVARACAGVLWGALLPLPRP